MTRKFIAGYTLDEPSICMHNYLFSVMEDNKSESFRELMEEKVWDRDVD